MERHRALDATSSNGTAGRTFAQIVKFVAHCIVKLPSANRTTLSSVRLLPISKIR